MSGGIRFLLTPDTDEARRLLEEELTEPPYVEAQPGIVERIISEILRGIARLLDGMGGLAPGPGTLVLALGAVLAVIVAVVLIKPRLNARGRKQESAVFDDDATHSADHHRGRAAALATARDWNGAVAEVLRAVIRSAEERLVVADQPGRTATEAAAQLGAVFAPLSADVAWLAEVFNETHYGSGTASGDAYRRAAALDARLSAERPIPSADTTAPAAPR
ncbi:DUF4129 domain-containing protein [Arthrobacter sp. L77]|uniref:DUF4129 domain-containing protein n=1 Tax=Arthrobacter sp. L77 TaxID=1496689 RepID=UPI00068C42E7|nr:DUF4129 domain-containing protein [Arthrobacter sp. L77]